MSAVAKPPRNLSPPRRLRPSAAAPLSLDEPEAPIGRIVVFGAILLLLLGVLGARLWYLQILKGGEYHAQALSNRNVLVRTMAPRGAIVDRRGRTLVTNNARFTVFVSPPDLPKNKAEREAVLNRAAQLTRTSREEIEKQRIKNPNKTMPFAIAENVDKYTLARMAENRRLLPGISVETEPVRQYNEKKMAAHVLGYIRQVSEEQLKDPEITGRGYVGGDFIGKDGVERSYDNYLNGKAGGVVWEVDAKRRRVRQLEERAPVAGRTLRLTLDYDVQKAAENALGQRRGAVVALDPRTGRVLAMTSYPAYNPNVFTERIPRQEWKKHGFDDKKAKPLWNRATRNTIAPGSTFKIVTSAAVLAEGIVTPHSGFFCSGGISLGGRKRCHGVHGGVSLTGALAKSCDVYYYLSSLRLLGSRNPEKLGDWARHFGMGAKTGIDLPGEEAGVVAGPAWKKKWGPIYQPKNPHAATWYPGDQANIAIGQGDGLATPLQVALYSAAIANRGVLYEPYVVEAALDGKTGRVVYETEPKVLRRLPLSSEHRQAIANGMRAVVTSGTSKLAALPGIAVAGKSGSAEVFRGSLTHGWFTCYAPFEKPTIAICVFLESDGRTVGYHGGAECAPVAKEVMAAYFASEKKIAAQAKAASATGR